MCELCLLVLSTPTVQRETITHASTVLIHVVMASWRGRGRWPPCSAASDTTRARTTICNADTTPPSGRKLEEASSQLTQAASTMLFDCFFSGGEGGRGHGHHHADADEMRTLLVSFLPLPPDSGVAVCRALLHIVDPGVLLVRADCRKSDSTGGGGVIGKVDEDNLLLGPILNAILSRCGSESGLQLRFFALQVSLAMMLLIVLLCMLNLYSRVR